MPRQNDQLYEFETFRINSVKRQLICDGEVLPLTSKAFDTLLILIRRRGETVSKNELINSLWFDTAVEENNLTQQISALRKALGDNPRQPNFIFTVPGQGYCFIAPVRETSPFQNAEIEQMITLSEIKDENLETDKKQSEAKEKFIAVRKPEFSKFTNVYGVLAVVLFSAAVFFSSSYFIGYLNSKPSICVLPFKSLDSSEKSNLYSAGIPSFVTAKIGNLPEMIVRPTNLSGKYYGQEQNVQEIGRRNGVDAVLTGSTLCEGDVVQVTVHLWDVKNNRQIWAKIFTGKASETILLQNTISEEIIVALQKEYLN